MNELDSRTARRIADIKAKLTARAMTTAELSESIHINVTSVQLYMRALLGNRVFIESWRRVPGHIIAVYRWGESANAPKPLGRTAAQSERDRIKRIRKDPDAYALHLAKSRARYAADKATRTPQTPFSALFVVVRATLNAEG